LWLLLGLLVLAYLMSRSRPIRPLETTVERLAEAIATAEGYFVPGSLPARMHNPGALRLHGERNTISYFATDEEGWEALREQLRRIFTGQSRWYTPEMSIRHMAQVWTGGDNPDGWAETVARRLGVTPQERLTAV